jgi:tight adherence protein B
MFEFKFVYLFYLLIGLSAAMFADGFYLLFYRKASYRKNINRRVKVADKKTDRESVLVQLRRERGLTSGGDYRLPLVNLNQLLLQSGLSIGFSRLILFIVTGMIAAFAGTYAFDGNLLDSALAALFCGTVLPWFVLRILRKRRQKKFSAQFPDAIEIIVRSLRAGHPVPIAISMVAREMPDPIGSEFGIVTDDLPLFVTAVAIQGATGGNLGEILENLSGVIRQRFKMRRKIRALAAEGRATALVLSLLPIGIFIVLLILVPNFYGSVWNERLTKIVLALAGCWMGVGNYMMYRLVNFRI